MNELKELAAREQYLRNEIAIAKTEYYNELDQHRRLLIGERYRHLSEEWAAADRAVRKMQLGKLNVQKPFR